MMSLAALEVQLPVELPQGCQHPNLAPAPAFSLSHIITARATEYSSGHQVTERASMPILKPIHHEDDSTR